MYDELNPPRGRGDNNRFALKNKVSKITDRLIDELLKGTDSSFLSKPYSFMKKFESLGFMSNENPDEDQDIAANKSSYRKMPIKT